MKKCPSVYVPNLLTSIEHNVTSEPCKHFERILLKLIFLCRKKFDLQKESSNVIDNGYPSNGLFKSQKIRVMKRLVMMMMGQLPETLV